MTRDELIALLLVGGFVQDRLVDKYPHRAHVYHTDTIAVSIVPDEEWGVWDGRALALARPHALAHAHDLARPQPLAHALALAHALGTPDEYSKLWQTIKELLDDQR